MNGSVALNLPLCSYVCNRNKVLKMTLLLDTEKNIKSNVDARYKI